MNVRYAVLLVMLAASGAVVSQKAIAGNAVTIPLPTGHFSITIQGSYAVCLNPKTDAQESCSTKGASPFPLTFTTAGEEIRGATGACATGWAVFSAFPPSALPPDVYSTAHLAEKLTDYDTSTGTGNVSYTGYNGGKCVGATFDSTGAKVTFTGTYHFVVSQKGDRIDAVATGLTDAIGSIGTFSYTEVLLRQ
jgi:hypothetical protein